MEVILKRDVDKVGKTGSILKVKDGYARNFLIPNGLAIPMTAENMKQLEHQKQSQQLRYEKIRKEAEDLKQRLAGVSLTMPVLTKEEDTFYGSITAQDIAAALKEEGFEIDKTAIMLTDPIKALGIYEIPVHLHQEVTAQVKVWIVKK